ncbi:MAG: carbohydrate-binding protein [Niastella sp.]|nr:carbohydrate-binding protein [Niastella sp.]
MKKSSTLLVLFLLLLCSTVNAQFIMLDDMEGNGPCSGRWTYYAGPGATGKVEFGVPNPAPSTLNPSPLVAKFTKDTTCFEYMSAGVNMTTPFDLLSNSTFKMMVYSTTTEPIMFKLQPGTDYTKAVYFTYKVSQVNRWEEATFNFQSVNTRTDFNRIEVHYIDGKKANGILYFDLVQAPNPKSITLTNTTVHMGQENGVVLQAKLYGDLFSTSLSAANWTSPNLPPGVTIGSVQRINDTVANITLSGNSPANYSRTTLKLFIAAPELQNPNTSTYTAKGTVTFEGNPNWTMIYNDEFNIDGVPDKTKWTVDAKPKGWINGEQQVYTDSTHDNARIKNGHLVITGKKDFPNGNTTEPWSSARVISQGKMDFQYGKVAVRAKLARARGSWPAIWLMPTTSAYGAWPRSGEIDIMEHVGNNFGTVLSTVHTQNNNWTNGGHLSASRSIPDADTAWHVYQLEWSPDSLRFVYDSTHCYTYVNPHTDWKDWPFDQKFHIILNVAIGGGMGGNIVEADWPDSMLVDYVRVYQKGLGTPVLDSVVVTPADMLILAGKTQQYAVKAFDQNGHAMNISPVWSITGTGNSITTGGLATVQSAGIVTATATVDTVTVSGQVNVNVRPTNYKPIPARIEAESFDNSNSCCTEPTADTSGVVNVSYIGANTWFEYDIQNPSWKLYRIQFRVAASYATSLKILLDTNTLGMVDLPASGGWQSWVTVNSAPFLLPPGQKTIRIQSNASGWNFNWLKFVPATTVNLTKIIVTPDSSTVMAGQTKQFTAAAYDQDNNYMNLLIGPLWHVTGSNNSINANGLLTAGNSTGTYTVRAIMPQAIGKAIVKIVPVPVLTRIAITPDSATVPPGASHQFKATGYDQFDSVMTFRPVWTVTGAGNTVDTTGIVTAGNTTGSYLLTATAGAISKTANVKVEYGCTVNGKYEAETSSNYASGPYLQPCTDVGGGQNFAGLAVGHYFAYNTLNVPVAGKYTVSVRISTTAPAQLKVGHSGLTFGVINLPNTGGAWQTIKSVITLPALSYTGIHVVSGTFKFNWFSIDNCAEPPPVLTRIELTPDTLQLQGGQAQQFIATGYDANNNTMPVNNLNWTVTGTGNTITTTGLLTTGTTPGTYTVTVNADTITAAAQVTVYNLTCTVNNKYEAETASNRSPGPFLQTCTDVGGGQNFAGLALNNFFAYNTLNVPTAGVYTVSLRVSTTAPAQAGVGHSGVIFGLIDIPNTGGAWQTISDTMTLPALTYTGIHVKAGTFKFNWFSIDDCVKMLEGGAAGTTPFTVAIEKEEKASIKAILYPNPTSGPLVINLSRNDWRLLKLLDIKGRLIQQWNIRPGDTHISKDVHFLQNGVYLLQLEGNHKSETLRLIKQ